MEHSTDSYQIRPSKVIVQPWLGLYQVFDLHGPLVTEWQDLLRNDISESFIGEFIPDSQPQVQQIDDVVAEPGYYGARLYPDANCFMVSFTGQLVICALLQLTIEISERSK
jgi:hypothetical protein